MVEKTIREIMYDERVTQTELARRLGISQASVSHMLHNGMSLGRLEEVLGILGYDIVLKKGDREYGINECYFG